MRGILETRDGCHGFVGSAHHKDTLPARNILDLAFVDVIDKGHGKPDAEQQEQRQQEIKEQGQEDDRIELSGDQDHESHQDDLGQDGGQISGEITQRSVPYNQFVTAEKEHGYDAADQRSPQPVKCKPFVVETAVREEIDGQEDNDGCDEGERQVQSKNRPGVQVFRDISCESASHRRGFDRVSRVRRICLPNKAI